MRWVFTRDDHPVQWATIQENLAFLHFHWSEHPACEARRDHLQTALTHVAAALEVYDPVYMEYDFGTATRLRESIQTALDRP